jgi:xanthosine utilization system XapX-like protein
MRRHLLIGIAAGATGTAALNVVTYLDMALRARPSSEVPAQVAQKMAEKGGIDLAKGIDPGEPVDNRKEAIGALLGYLTGLGVGGTYGLFRCAGPRPPTLLAGIGLGMAAMAASDVPATALGLTDPSSWPASSWAGDIVPHLAYGLVTAAAFDSLLDEH